MQQLEPPFTNRNTTALNAFNYLAACSPAKNDPPDRPPIPFQGNCVGIELWLHDEPADIVAAGFLHQVLNEDIAHPEAIAEEFGQEVLELIQSVSYKKDLFSANPHQAWMDVLRHVELAKENHGPLIILLESFAYQLRFMKFVEQGAGRQSLYDLSKHCLRIGRLHVGPDHYAATGLLSQMIQAKDKFPAIN